MINERQRRQVMARFLMPLVAAMTVLTGSCSASAQETTTLQKIADSKTITLGFHESTPPFTYSSADGKPMGYSFDIALKVAEAVKRELKLPVIQIKTVPFTTQNRFPMVQNGTADLTCGGTTHTTEREKLVAFSNTIFIAGARLMTRKDSGIKEFSDLNGKNVVTFAASTSEKMLRKMNTEGHQRINIKVSFDRGDTPVSLLQAGHADAFMMDDVLLYSAIHQTWRPDDWTVTGKPASFEAYACFMRRDDPGFKKVVDQEIARLMKSGEMQAIYQKWLMSPIPPKGTNYAFSISEAMLGLFKTPSDKPFD
jgi:glutamate/aspartate transport system substrate-binding protein